jgi:hypothetical protein
MKTRLVLMAAMMIGSTDAGATVNATANGQFMSIGVPSIVHQGTNGDFYLQGTDQGMCQSLMPTYFRFDTSRPHWKEMYALLLYAASNQKSMDCVVDSGCGTSEVWVSYCRTAL